MASDIEKLVVQLSADIRQYNNALLKAQGQTNKAARQIETRFAQMNKRIASSLAGLGTLTSLAGGALGVSAIQQYADAWTEAGNKIRAAASSAGVSVRTLDLLKEGANEARTSFADYVDLYARLIRSASGVAKSEQEIADATAIVSKAFKAGGASAQEQAAGILQLGQALGSGVLQGDELRSLRENAPILAQAIAAEFQTTIAGLKDLGAEGKLTSDRVFKAIINAQQPIQAQFAATKATIADAIMQVNNEFTAYVGNADASAGASAKLVEALQALAANFSGTADVVVQFATLVAGALAGRALLGLVAGLGNATLALGAFLASVRAGTVAIAGLNAALGPIGLLAGAAAAAIYLLQNRQTDAEKAADAHQQTLRELRFQIDSVDYSNSNAVASTRQKIQADIEAARTALARAEAERELAAAIVREEVSPSMSLLPTPGASDAANTVDSSPMVKDRQAVIDQVKRQIDDLTKAQTDFEDYASGKRKPKRDNTGFGGGVVAAPASSGGGSKSKAPRKTADDRFANDLQAIRDRTAALIQERENLSLNFEEQQKRTVALDLEQQALEQVREEARRKGDQDWQNAKLSPEQVRAIEEVSAAYAKQAEALRQAQEAQDLQRDILKGMFSDLRSALEDGKITAEEWGDIFGNVLDKIIDKIENDLIDAIFSANSAMKGGGGGGIGGLFSGLFGGGGGLGGLTWDSWDSGGYTGRGGKYEPAGMVHKGEYVFDQEAVRAAGGPGSLDALRKRLKGYADGGSVGMPSLPSIPSRQATPEAVNDNRQYNIDARGAQQGVGAEIRKALEEYDRKTLPRSWNRINQDRRVIG